MTIKKDRKKTHLFIPGQNKEYSFLTSKGILSNIIEKNAGFPLFDIPGTNTVRSECSN